MAVAWKIRPEMYPRGNAQTNRLNNNNELLVYKMKGEFECAPAALDRQSVLLRERKCNFRTRNAFCYGPFPTFSCGEHLSRLQ